MNKNIKVILIVFITTISISGYAQRITEKDLRGVWITIDKKDTVKVSSIGSNELWIDHSWKSLDCHFKLSSFKNEQLIKIKSDCYGNGITTKIMVRRLNDSTIKIQKLKKGNSSGWQIEDSTNTRVFTKKKDEVFIMIH